MFRKLVNKVLNVGCYVIIVNSDKVSRWKSK